MEKIQQYYLYEDPEAHEKMLKNHRALMSRVIEKLLDKGQNQEGYLGKGQTAEVYLVGKLKKRAVKVMNSRTRVTGNPSVAFTNTLHEESRLTDLVRNRFASDNISVPKQFVSIDYEDGETRGSILIMEGIKGISIQEALDHPEKLPRTFDKESFCESLRDFVEKMNAAGIFHRDLHTENIMVDLETGKPWIIDFGLATDSYSENPYLVDSAAGQIRFIPDEQRVRALNKKVRSLNINYIDKN
jgi:serine/threonine protein kinase